jgi:hypothetical protein
MQADYFGHLSAVSVMPLSLSLSLMVYFCCLVSRIFRIDSVSLTSQHIVAAAERNISLYDTWRGQKISSTCPIIRDRISFSIFLSIYFVLLRIRTVLLTSPLR